MNAEVAIGQMPLVSGKLRTSLFRVPFVAEQSFILLTIAPNGEGLTLARAFGGLAVNPMLVAVLFGFRSLSLGRLC